DKYMRAHAEFENARRRMEKDKADYARFANDSMILEFLPILDNLEIAEKHIKEAKDFKAVQEGVDMIQVQIQKFLKDIGVERIKTLGCKFDPHMHEPLEVAEAEDKDEGDILSELKPGYKINGRLLRPASVRIAKKKG
ncbi:MAG: nucleotide exchange factor GrpE, partial [Candidatus Omnitrophota bacterium]|nr:nucleotide exchange factor GrpE [Candidatus Omnitrophota bacterium]